MVSLISSGSEALISEYFLQISVALPWLHPIYIRVSGETSRSGTTCADPLELEEYPSTSEAQKIGDAAASVELVAMVGILAKQLISRYYMIPYSMFYLI